MPQPLAVEATQRQLAQVYAAAWQRIVDEQQRILHDPAQFRRRSRLVELRQEVERQLSRVDEATRAWLEHEFPNVYAWGAQAGAEPAGETITSWTLIHTRALDVLVSDTHADLLAATRFIRKDVKRFIRDAAAELTRLKVATGRTATDVGKELTRFLSEKGLRGVRYRDGSMHGLDEYGQMVIRTKTAVAYNEGTLNGATDAGIRYFEVFDGPDCGWTFHEDPDLALGMIVTADEARAEPISHPNCRRTFGGRPDVVSKKGTRTATRSSTEAQRQDQIRFDAERRAMQRARSARRVRSVA